MDVRSPASTRLPITAASRSTSIVASSSRSSRAINTSRRDDGSGPLPSSASSSSTWNGFPSASATTRAASAASTVTPAIAATWAIDGGVVQRDEPDVVQGRVPLEPGQDRREGVPAMQLVGAEGEHEDDAGSRQAASEEGDHVERRAIGPVEVVDDGDDVGIRGDSGRAGRPAAGAAPSDPVRRLQPRRPPGRRTGRGCSRPRRRRRHPRVRARPATRGSGGRGASRRPRGSRHGGPEPVARPADLRSPNPASSAISRLLPIPASPLTSTTTRSLVRAAAVAARSRSRSSSTPDERWAGSSCHRGIVEHPVGPCHPAPRTAANRKAAVSGTVTIGGWPPDGWTATIAETESQP